MFQPSRSLFPSAPRLALLALIVWVFSSVVRRDTEQRIDVSREDYTGLWKRRERVAHQSEATTQISAVWKPFTNDNATRARRPEPQNIKRTNLRVFSAPSINFLYSFSVAASGGGRGESKRVSAITESMVKRNGRAWMVSRYYCFAGFFF
jgi:hypothetical protein